MSNALPPTTFSISAEMYRVVPKLAGDTDVVWAQFDPAWYLATYASVHDEIIDASPDAVLYFYLQHGRRLRHSPNRFFDEAWYVQAYSDVADEIEQGLLISGFQHYCRVGYRDRCPHWLFDEALYRRNHPDLSDDVLRSAGFVNGYDHFLRHGSREGRIGHFLFDGGFYAAQLAPDAASEAEKMGPFRHYLERIGQGKSELPISPYFDPTWYMAKYEDVGDMLAAGGRQCALAHYLCSDTPTAFDPLPQFSEAYYLGRYADVAMAVARGEYRNGYAHFLREGRFKSFSPSSMIDLAYYEAQATVQEDLEQGRATDSFTHLLTIGRAAGLATTPEAEEVLSEAQARALFLRKSQEWLPIFARSPLSFACAGEPTLGVVMAVHGHYATTLATLASLRHAYGDNIELLLVDAGSQDDTRQIERFVTGATPLRFDEDVGLIAGRNAGLHLASSDTLLFLGNEVELAPGAVGAGLRRLASDPTIGAVGGKVLRGDGVLREAGNRIGPDARIEALQAGASALCPEANYVREVDFCSSAFLLIRTELLREIGGFSPGFHTLRFVDADLGAAIAAAGYRTVYDPSVSVYDHRQDGMQQQLEADRQMFLRKHGERGQRYTPVRRPSCNGRLIFIETTVERLAGSGFVRSNDILQVIASLGWQATVFPLRGSHFDLASVFTDLPDTFEIMYDRSIADLRKFLAERAGHYDVLWIGRTHNLDSIADILRSGLADNLRHPQIVLDTEAIAALREAVRAQLPEWQGAFDLASALAREFTNASLCDRIVAVSPQEAECLRALGYDNVAVLGHMRDIKPTPRSFDERAGLLFVGAIHEESSPNYDSLCWFVDAVLPIVEEALGWETRLTIAGYVAEQVDMRRFQNHPRITLRGMVADLEPLYDMHRVFIAPARFAAGIPYKVYEAASYGLPVFVSEILRLQMGWENGRDLLAVDAADPRRVADALVALYRDAGLWQEVRENALQRLRSENNRERYASILREILANESDNGDLRGSN